MKLGIGIGLDMFPKVGAVAFGATYQTIYDGLGTPPDAVNAAKQNTMVEDLVDGGEWAKIDVWQWYAQTNAVDALLDWIGSNNATLVNAPAHASVGGFTGNGSNAYVNTHFNPSTDGVNYVRNSAHFGVHIMTNVKEAFYDLGVSEGGQGAFIQTRNAGDEFLSRINDNTNETGASLDSTGTWIDTRNASGAAKSVIQYKNGIEVGDNSSTSSVPRNIDFFVLTLNNAGSPFNYSTKQAACFFAGGDLTIGEALRVSNAIQTCLA